MPEIRRNLRDVEASAGERYAFIHADLANAAAVAAAFAGRTYDAVVNFAAESHVDRSIEGPEVFVPRQHHRHLPPARSRP